MKDAYVDEVAVERATQADASVWPRLTRAERAEALVRVRRRRQAEQAENAAWSHLIRQHSHRRQSGGGCLPYDHDSPLWLKDVAAAGGYRDVRALMEAAAYVERRRAHET